LVGFVRETNSPRSDSIFSISGDVGRTALATVGDGVGFGDGVVFFTIDQINFLPLLTHL
jgi:hypothetical protein